MEIDKLRALLGSVEAVAGFLVSVQTEECDSGRRPPAASGQRGGLVRDGDRNTLGTPLLLRDSSIAQMESLFFEARSKDLDWLARHMGMAQN